MGLRLALCQYKAETGNVGANLSKIMSVLNQTRSDVYIFPEMFLTGCDAEYALLADNVLRAVDRIRLWCMEKDIAVLVGSPSYCPDGMRNSLLFITSKDVVQYDKLYLAHSGTYSEKDFVRGDRPVLCSFKDMTFGLSIGYDIFFPEIYRNYALSGADVNICVSASAAPSEQYFERVIPARSLENLIYTVFVNGAGTSGDPKHCGMSRLVGPLGNTLSSLGGDEGTLCVYVDREVVGNARKENKHLEDIRTDIKWIRNQK